MQMSSNGIIGYEDGSMAFNCQDDLKWFQKICRGKICLVGRKTYENCGCIPDSLTVVVSKQCSGEWDRIIESGVLHIPELERFLVQTELCPVIVVGGKSLFEAFNEEYKVLFISVFDDELPARRNGFSAIYAPNHLNPFDQDSWGLKNVEEVNSEEFPRKNYMFVR